MNKEKDLISVIVPCYNEEEALPLFYKEAGQVLSEIGDVDYEFVFVDDGSSDGTLSVIKSIAAKDERVHYIVFSRNFGKEAGMYAGLSEARGDYCVIMDADLQHPPELLPEMYRRVRTGTCDCCGGFRKGREGDGFLRSFFSRAFYKISRKLTHLDMSDGHGDFRMMSRNVVSAILEMREYNRYMKGLFSFVGFETEWIEYENAERAAGNSKWSFKSLFAYALEGILSFSTAPLKLAGLAGIVLFLSGTGFMATQLFCSFRQLHPVSGMDVVVFIVLLSGGLQMLFLYILGAYVSKDYLENKRRPVYIVKERN